MRRTSTPPRSRRCCRSSRSIAAIRFEPSLVPTRLLIQASPRRAALQALQRYPFPGNIRELENVLERAFTLCESGVIQPEDLLLPATTSGLSTPLAAPPAYSSSPSIRSEPVAPTTPVRYLDEPKTQPMLPMVNNLEGYLEGLEKAAILRALEATRYNKTAAAEKLGISFRALRYRLKKLGLE